MGLLSLLGLIACDNAHTVLKGSFKGKPYELLSIETKGFSTNRIDYALKLGSYKQVRIDALTTDWGPPYADELYGNARRVYIDKSPAPYSNQGDDPQRHPATMLYLSPERFSKDVFEQYASLLQSEWPVIDQQFARDEYDRFPRILGLVYGEPQSFARLFTGKKEGKPHAIKVEPDGRVRYSPLTDWANDEYSGLSDKVQMPGKHIYVATGKLTGLTLAQVQSYKDELGKTLSDYFLVQETPDTLSLK
ncbi:hypothetical protein [Fibrella forsythiae]|uniref:Uncharacterized protein n=1 Tax=Fibrella forsythiae TaxID=2817061 RepID=A0ABS3JM41_9BACT|nr:hypothetical protein [Fibrella forsythiae]MBO0951063.1 hypothetical protein [Fibrella forsythiae]